MSECDYDSAPVGPSRSWPSTARQRSVADTIRLQAKRHPHKIALLYEGNADTYKTLNCNIDRAANALRVKGILRGDRVAFLSHNNRSFVILRYAVMRLGAVFTPINFMLNPDEVAYILDHAGAKACIVEDSLCSIADEAISKLDLSPKFKAYIRHNMDLVPDGWIDGDALLDFEESSPVTVSIEEDAPIQLMYTSGTESRPKGVLLSSRSLLSQYMTCIVDGGMDRNDIELHAMPLYHCGQLDCFLSVDLYLGATSVLLRGPDAGKILETIEQEQVTKFFCPPTVWISLLRHQDFEKRNLSSLTKGYYGASIMPTSIIEEILERLPQIRLYNFYGQTELAPLATVLGPEDQMRKLGSAGLPGLNVETCIADDGDSELPRGEVGEIVHRSPQAMLGYYKDETKTMEAFRNGWFHSGDLGWMDEEGFVYIVDRKKDMIKSGGENVSSREVEEILFSHQKITEAAVIGLPDDRWIEAVTAVIVLRPRKNMTAEEVSEYCQERLAGYKTPKNIYFATSLPKNASGKVLKRELRNQFLEMSLATSKEIPR